MPEDIRISADCSTWAAVFGDGRLEFGRLASGKRWNGTVPAELQRGSAVPQNPPEGSGLAISRDGAVCAVWRGARIAVLQVETGQQRCLATVPEPVRDICLSNDGKRLAASLHHTIRGYPDNGITILDTSSGQRVARLHGFDENGVWRPEIAWIGDDATACVMEVDGSHGATELPFLGSWMPGVVFTPLSSRVPREVPGRYFWPPIIGDRRGTAFAVTHVGGSVLMLNAPALTVRSEVSVSDAYEPIRAMAMSDDGATVAAASEEGGGQQPRKLFVVDMPHGTVRPFYPRRSRIAYQVAVVASGALLVALSIWLLSRTRAAEAEHGTGCLTITDAYEWAGGTPFGRMWGFVPIDKPTLTITEGDTGGMVFEGDVATFDVHAEWTWPAGRPTVFYSTMDPSGAAPTDYVSSDGPQAVAFGAATYDSDTGTWSADATIQVNTVGGIDGGGDGSVTVQLTHLFMGSASARWRAFSASIAACRFESSTERRMASRILERWSSTRRFFPSRMVQIGDPYWCCNSNSSSPVKA